MTLPQYIIVALVFTVFALVMGASKDALYIVLCLALMELFRKGFLKGYEDDD